MTGKAGELVWPPHSSEAKVRKHSQSHDNGELFRYQHWRLSSYCVCYSASLLSEILNLGLICSFDPVLDRHIIFEY